MRKLLAAVLAGLFTVFLAGPSLGATRLAVPLGGSTTDATCNPTACTMTRALAVAACGDTVTAADGTYSSSAFEPAYACTSEGNRITIKATNTGSAVLDTTDSEGAFRIKVTSDYTTIQGFKITRNTAGPCIYMEGDPAANPSHITLKDIECAIDHATSAEGFDLRGATDLLVENCNIHNTRPTYLGNNNGPSCIGFDAGNVNGGSNLTFRGGTCKDWWSGITIKNATNVVVEDWNFVNIHDHNLGWADVDEADVRRNKFWQTESYGFGYAGDFMALWCSTDVRVYNNSMSGNAISGPVLGTMPTDASPCNNSPDVGPEVGNGNNARIRWVNNIIMRGIYQYCIQAATSGGAPFCAGGAGQNCLSDHHNIYYDCDSNGTSNASENTAYDNGNRTFTYWTSDAAESARWQPSGFPGANSSKSNPLVVDDTTGDFHLQSGSPARDAGDDTLCAHTISGAHCDIGAYEFNSAAVCGNNVIESGELCDGSALNSQTCVTQGFSSGTLACASNCLSYDTSACVASVRPNLRGVVMRGAVIQSGTTAITQFTETFESGVITPFPVWLQQLHNASNGFETGIVRNGVKSFRFVVAQADELSGTTRAELLRFNNDAIGSEAWYGWSFYVPTDYVDSTLFQIIGQWHPPLGIIASSMIAWQIQTTSPTTSVSLGLFMRKNAPTLAVQAFTDVTKGAWHDLVTHVKYSTDNAVGYVDAWVDGVNITAGPVIGATSDVAGGTEPGFFSFGLYRYTCPGGTPPCITSTNTIYADDLRIGRSYAEVAVP